MCAHQRQIGQTVPAHSDRDREIEHRLARVMHRTSRRHGASPRESPLARPLPTAVCSNNAAPAEEIRDSPPDSTRGTDRTRIRFTYGVPFGSEFLDLQQAQNPVQDRHFRV
ncbi:hypothetical protein GCM10009547_34830 [Sporichthya brevicatena]|uniref:Uncharacterized protein n=1 Tax=Sporichthya brevicatena TaxID=171442 RepID=A0ABP3S7C3_9ACTN